MSAKSGKKKILKENTSNESSAKNLIIMPLRMLAILSAISGVLALIFEVQSLVIHSLEVYISRLAATVVAFVVLVISQTEFGKKKPEILVHAMVIAVILSSGFVVYRIPSMFQVNSNIIALYVFMIGLSMGWKYIHQMAAVVYFLIIYFAAIITTPVLYSNTQLVIETSAIVIVLCIMSVVSSAVIYSARERIFAGLHRTHPESLGKEHNYFKEILRNTPIGFYQFRSNGKIIFANKAFANMFGFESVKEILSKNIYELIFEKSKERESLEKILLENKKIKNYRMSLKKKDNSKLIVKIDERIVHNDEDNSDYHEGNILDITQQINAENTKKKELEKLKAESTNANYKANSAVYNSQVKSQFLAKMSHEIRTPMNSVLGFLTLIENGLFDSETELRDFAHNARISADSLLDIINNVLDLSKIEAGKMELSEEEFSIREEIEKAISIIKTIVKEKNLEVNSNISSGVPISVFGDSIRYRQVVVNLLSNASKYTKSGSISIDVDIVKKTDATIKILTTVSDTGIGIKKEKLSQLFKPYIQLSNEKKINRKGTGLGLIICKDFVSLMGGKIDVESEEGKGTKIQFTVVLGLEKNFLKTKGFDELNESEDLVSESDTYIENKEVVHEKVELPEGKERTSAQNNSTAKIVKINSKITTEPKPLMESIENNVQSFPRTTMRKKRLLLVEDNPISQRVELKLLRETGYSVDPVSNAYDAIAAIKSNAFDLVLMDIEMEDINGIEATQKIRALEPPVNKIPIIAVTAHSSMKDRERCLAAGMDDYIAKPINIHFLKMTIDQWLKAERR